MLTIVAGLLVALACSIIFAQDSHNQGTLRPLVLAIGQNGAETVRPPSVSFRYVIVFDGPLHNGRLVEVLMDPRTFSEKNLMQLFNLIAKRFPEPEELHAGVFTSLEQLPTPEEQDYMIKTNTDWLPFMDQVKKWPSAAYSRNAANEGFKYSSANRKNITVIIKGSSPFERDKK